MMSKKQLPTPEEQLNQIGEGLKSLRLARGFTNYEYLAYEIGMSRSQYGQYENGRNMNIKTLIKILEFYDLSLKEFFEEKVVDVT